MKEHIHTIPVIDAFKESLENGGCPFCLMREKLERNAVDFIMGPAYMEEDVRMETNAVGFCPAHLEKMYAEQNRLGLALMLHTHVQQINRDMDNVKKNLGGHLEKTVKSCYVCKRVDETFIRYIETFFKLWLDGGAEAELIEKVSGYCLPHFAMVLSRAEKLGKAKYARFAEKFLPTQRGHFHRFLKSLTSSAT